MIPLIILAIEDTDDRDFMTDLYISYNKLMFSQILTVTKDVWVTEDLMQTVLVKLIDKIHVLKGLEPRKRSSYIISACRNTAYTYLNKQKRMGEVEIIEADSILYSPATLDEQLISEERESLIGVAWEKLDERSRYFLEGKYILEKSDEEIAADMAIKPASVRMNLTRARNNFKKELTKQGVL